MSSPSPAPHGSVGSVPPVRLGFVGAGRMAQAIAAGLQASDATRTWPLSYHDPSPAAQAAFSRSIPVAQRCEDNQALCTQSDVVILAVKPQAVPKVMPELASCTRGRLVLSVIAGLSLEKMALALGHERIVRAMPNTPALIAQGATAFAVGQGCQATDRRILPSILESIGWSIEVSEIMLNAVTGLSGSGPAYVMLVIEALADGGVRMGLPRDTAQQLAIRTVLGAASLASQTGEHPAILREQVTSPGGTTAAGLAALEAGAVRYHFQAAVEMATRRAAELGG